jgi:hypothetical protein
LILRGIEEMAPSFSHKQILSASRAVKRTKSPQPGAKHGESDLDTGIRLEAKDASFSASPQSTQPFSQKGLTEKLFVNGWFCTRCNCITEHHKVKNRQVCDECDFRMGKEPEKYSPMSGYEEYDDEGEDW